MINKRFVILVGLVAISSIILSVVVIYATHFTEPTTDEKLNYNDPNKITLDDESLFNRITDKNAFVIKNGKKVWYSVEFKLKPELTKIYEEISAINDTKNTVVIYPLFTVSAHSGPQNFDYFYMGLCNELCLTVPIEFDLRPDAGGDAVQILNLLGYKFISDADLDKNPNGLSKYDKVILLENEYVTKNEFSAITKHPHVLYLYPNVFLGEVKADYEKNTITLLKGKDYPEKGMANGFDWKFNNSTSNDSTCDNWKFNKIDNGIMLNCNPDDILYKDKDLLKVIKDF